MPLRQVIYRLPRGLLYVCRVRFLAAHTSGIYVTVPAATLTLKAGLDLADDLLPRCAWNRPMSKAHKGENVLYMSPEILGPRRGARARACTLEHDFSPWFTIAWMNPLAEDGQPLRTF